VVVVEEQEPIECLVEIIGLRTNRWGEYLDLVIGSNRMMEKIT
jgi:hypothetical protein